MTMTKKNRGGAGFGGSIIRIIFVRESEFVLVGKARI